MIAYVTLGTNDLERAAAWYDELFATLGIGRYMEEKGYFVAWAPGPDQPSVALTKPFDGKPATVGNGVMVALLGRDPEQVRRFHARALELGASDEGAPGFRPAESSSGFYAGYFRDPEGNKFNIFCIVPDAK